eukprot:m.263135 g.263135  ORF g.263135 m.263135 type:complete len:401 (-) comp16226_c2_seq33:994-2196(-)
MSYSARDVSFAERLELPFGARAFPNALALGDVDQDGTNELVTTSTDGRLSIFKGTGIVPWRHCSGLGWLTCVCVGDARNMGNSEVVCATTEGSCYMFVCGQKQEDSTTTEDRIGLGHKSQSLEAELSQHLVLNIRDVFVGDIDKDGLNELVVATTDRRVLAYRWDATQLQLMLLWSSSLPGQIGAMALIVDDLKEYIAVSQPGGTIILINTRNGNRKRVIAPEYSLGATTEIVGPIIVNKSAAKTDCDYFGVCTNDGYVGLHTTKDVIWNRRLEAQLFAISLLPQTKDRPECLASCAWNGLTFLLDYEGNLVRFELGKEICAFVTGMYGLLPNENVPCIVYITTNQSSINPSKILIFKTDHLVSIKPQGPLSNSWQARVRNFMKQDKVFFVNSNDKTFMS